MKIKPVIAGLVGLFVLLVAGFLIVQQTRGGGKNPTLSEIKGSETERLQETIDLVFGESRLPKDEEIAFLKWLFSEHPESAANAVQQYGHSVGSLPKYLSEAIWELLQNQENQTAILMTAVASEVFPRNPDILGMRGILGVLSGQTEVGRRMLEDSALRQPGNPRVDFYLGGLLVMSDNIAARSRGKKLLMGVLESDEEELPELAGFILLSNLEVPLLEEEIRGIYAKFEESDVFRTDNPNMNAGALRNVLTRLVPILPEEALTVAEILLKLPESTPADRLSTIELSQQLGLQEKASDLLEAFDIPLEEESELFRQFMRIQAIQLIAEEKAAEGVDIILQQIESTPSDYAPLLQTMNRAIDMDLPIAQEVRLLRGFLQLPVDDVARSIAVLRRLIEIAPLREEEWIEYARTQLLHLDPALVGQWMMQRGASEAVVEALSNKETGLGNREYIALIEASLAIDELEMAQQYLSEAQSQLSPTVANFLQCRILIQKDDLEEAFHYWVLAHDSALMGNNYQLLKNLGFLALEMGQKQSGLQSLYNAFDSGIPFSSSEAGELMRLTLEMGTLAQTLPVAEFLAERNPDNSTHQNNLAYFNFLAERDVDASVDIMRGLIDDYPDIYQFRLTLALGLIKAGRTNEASRLVQSTNIDWQEAGTRGQMIYAVVLAATNQRVIAEGLVSNLDKSSLLPEERALLAEF